MAEVCLRHQLDPSQHKQYNETKRVLWKQNKKLHGEKLHEVKTGGTEFQTPIVVVLG